MSNKAAAILAGTAILVGVLIGRASADTGNTAGPKAKQVTSQALDPTAYPRTKQGAATAAQTYDDVLFQSTFFMTAEQRRGIVETISSDAMRDQIAQDEEQAASIASKGLDLPKDQDQVVTRVAPLGWRVTSFTNDSARVEIWSVVVFGKPGVGTGIAPQFKTRTFDLAFERGGWRLAGTPLSKDGPTPVADNAQANTDILNATRDLQEFSHVAR